MVEYERQVCPRCGNLKSVCSDRERTWHAGAAVCWPSATREWAWRRIQKQYEGVEGTDEELGPLDGLLVYASEFEPPEAENPFD